MIQFMSPAGSGRGQFRGRLAARVDPRGSVHVDAPLVAPGGLARDSRADLAVRRVGVPSRGDLGLACFSMCRRVHPRSFARRRGRQQREWLPRRRSGLLADQVDVAAQTHGSAGMASGRARALRFDRSRLPLTRASPYEKRPCATPPSVPGVHSAFPFCDLAAQLSRRPERGF